MDEILPGLHHWKRMRETIGQLVSSYFFEPGATVLDPMVPEGDLEELEGLERPATIVLTNRHHYRESDEFVAAFGCTVHVPEPGLHEFSDGRAVEGYMPGDVLAPGVEARAAGAICPDDFVLRIAAGQGALAFADGLINTDDGVSFVPDFLMDDPEQVKQDMRAVLRRVLDEEEFDHLLFAHGDPIVKGGRAALEQFLG